MAIFKDWNRKRYSGDNLGAGLLYQTEYRSELKLSGSKKSDEVRLEIVTH